MTIVAGLEARLDAVIDGVLQQRLQHERRHQRVARHGVELPFDAQPLPSRSCSMPRYWRHSSTSRASGVSSRLSAISTRKSSAMSSSASSARRGSWRISDSTALMLLKRKWGRMRA